jgi:hypothetical protein
MESDSSCDFYSEFEFSPETQRKRKREKIETPFVGVPSLHILFKRTYVKLKAVRKMLALGADIEEKQAVSQHTPLHAAVLNHKNVVEYLLEQGADVFARTAQGNTPLHLNAIACIADISALLLMNGADTNAQNEKGETPTHLAADVADAAFVRNLLDFGANTSIMDNNGNTVLHHAANRYVTYWRDDEDYDDPILQARYKRYVVRLLLQYDGNWCKLDALQVKNNNGDTAMNIADNSGDDNTVGNELEQALIPAKEEARERSIRAQAAFAMGHHERLGQASSVQQLHPDMLRMVLSYM